MNENMLPLWATVLLLRATHLIGNKPKYNQIAYLIKKIIGMQIDKILMSLIWYHFMDKEQTSNTELEQLYRICPSCSFFCNTLEEDKFCSLCGSELIEACPNCKNSISNPYANYCKHCGESYPGRSSKGNSEGW